MLESLVLLAAPVLIAVISVIGLILIFVQLWA
jgi:hypothetical protein